MEINTTFIWLSIFIEAVIIATLYNEIKELKRRSRSAWSRPLPKYDNPPAPPLSVRAPTPKGLLERKDEEIKSLKAELNKVKFDYACEVAGNSGSKLTKKVAELESIIADKDETIKMLKPEKTEEPKKVNNDCPCCAGTGEDRIGNDCPTCCGTGQNNVTRR